jgi:hypothetical protein
MLLMRHRDNEPSFILSFLCVPILPFHRAPCAETMGATTEQRVEFVRLRSRMLSVDLSDVVEKFGCKSQIEKKETQCLSHEYPEILVGWISGCSASSLAHWGGRTQKPKVGEGETAT